MKSPQKNTLPSALEAHALGVEVAKTAKNAQTAEEVLALADTVRVCWRRHKGGNAFRKEQTVFLLKDGNPYEEVCKGCHDLEGCLVEQTAGFEENPCNLYTLRDVVRYKKLDELTLNFTFGKKYMATLHEVLAATDPTYRLYVLEDFSFIPYWIRVLEYAKERRQAGLAKAAKTRALTKKLRAQNEYLRGVYEDLAWEADQDIKQWASVAPIIEVVAKIALDDLTGDTVVACKDCLSKEEAKHFAGKNVYRTMEGVGDLICTQCRTPLTQFLGKRSKQ